MKAFVLLLTIAFASRFVDVESRMTMQQITTALKNVRKSCIAKSGVTKEVLDATREGVWATDDRNLWCYYHCNMKMMKALGKDGKFSLENTARQADTMLPEEFVEEAKIMAGECSKQITSEDECEGPFQYAKCNWETHPNVYFFA